MSEGGTQYDLRLGLDTGPAKPGIEGLAADLVATGKAADQVQDKLSAVSAASGRVGTSAKTAGAASASAAASTDKLATSAARTDSAATAASSALGRLSTSAAAADASSARASRSTENLGAASTRTAATTERLNSAADHLSTSLATESHQASAASASTEQLSASNTRANTSMTSLWRTLVGVVGVYVSLQAGISGFRSVVDNFSTYETALVDVSKTTGITGRDLKDFYGDILHMSTSSVPLATKDLLGIAQAAGSLGVTGKENIERYATSVGKLSAASEDLKGAEAATLLTRMMNVQGEGPENIERLSSVIIRLGLSSAATEREIALVGTEVSKGLAAFRIGTTQAAAYGAALAEMGIEAEAGSTALQHTFGVIQEAVSKGGKALDQIAKVAGVSAKAFADAWRADKVQGLNLFLKGLAKFGDDAGSVLKKVGLPDVRVQKALETFAFNFDKLAEKQRMAADEAVHMTSLNEKSGMVFASVTSDLQRLQNAYDGVEKVVGDALSPSLRAVSADLRNFAEEAENGAQRLGEAMGQAMRQVVALAILLARHFDLLKDALLAFLAVRFSAWIGGAVSELVVWLGAISGVTVALAAQAAATLAAAAGVTAAAEADAAAAAAKVALLEEVVAEGAAVAAETVVVGEAATILDVYAASMTAAGEAVARTGTVTDLYNEELVAHDAAVSAAAVAQGELAAANAATAASEAELMAAMEAEAYAMDAARASSKGFLSLGITPLTVGLGLLLAGILLVNDRLVEFSRNAQAEMESMVQKTNDFAAAIQKLRDDTKGLINDQAKAAEVQRKLLEEGVKPGRSAKDDDRAQQIKNQVEADYQKRRVAALYEQKTALEENQKALVGYRGELDQLREKEKALLQQQEENKKSAANAAADPHEAGMDGVVRSMAATDDQLEAVRARMVDVQNAANMTGSKVKVLTKTTDELTTSTKDYIPPAETAKRSLSEMGATVDKAALKYDHIIEKIDGATRAQNAISDAYGRSSKEGREVERQMELQNRQFEAAGMYEGALKKKIEDRVALQVEADRRSTGSKTIADLKDQITAAENLATALASGLQPAIEKARRDQDLLQQKLHNTSGAAADQAGTIEALTTQLDDLGKSNAFATQEDQLKKETAALADAAKTWDGTTASITNTNNVLQINAQISQAIVGHTDAEAAAIARLIRQQNLYNALFQARMNLGQIEEETRKQQDLYDIKRSDYLFEFQYQEALRKVNTEHEVRAALLSVEFLRQKALTSVKREDFETEQAYLAQRASIGKQFDDIATRTETAIRKQGELYVEIKKIDTLGEDVWGAFAESMKSAVTQAFETGKVDWEGIWKSFMDRLLGTFLDVLEEMFKRWVATQLAMAAVSAALSRNAAAGSAVSAAGGGVGGGLSSIGGTAGGIWGGTGGTGGGVTAAGIWGSGGTAGAAGSGSGVAGLFSGTGAAGAVGMVAAWVAVMVVFAIAVNKLSAHMQKTEEDVIQFNSALDVQMVKGGDHIGGLITAGQKLAEEIKSFFISYGGIFDGLNAAIALKRRGRGGNTEWKVYVDGVVTSFGKDADAAMNFALIEAIKHSSSTGLDPLVVAAIKDYTGKSIDEFKAQIDFAQRLATQNLPGISGQVSAASTQYFADLHQAQITFKDDAAALDLAVESITRKFSDTVQALKNSALGIDTSTADFLASLGAFNDQMAKSAEEARKVIEDRIAATQASIDGMGTGPRISRGGSEDDRAAAQQTWDETIARLRHQIDEYTAELDKIPKQLTDSEISMAIFDSLYKYLEGNAKYAKQAHEYAVLKVQLEFAAIQAQLIALGKWEEFAGMWQDALNAATKQADGKGGGGHGSGKKQDRQDFMNSLRDIERSALPESVQGVLALKDKLDEMTKKAKELKISEDKLAAARQVLIDQQKKAILDPVKQYLRSEDGGTLGMSQWDTQKVDIEKKFDDARAANQKLLDETGQRAIAFWKLNAAELEALKKLAEDAIASLGLPLEQTKNKVANLKSTLDFLKKSVDAGTLSQERYNEVIGEVAQQSKVEILGLLESIFETLSQTGAHTADAAKKSSELQAQLAQANFLMQVAQVNILYNALSALGDAGTVLQEKLKPFLDYVNDQTNWPKFDAKDYVTTSSANTQTTSDPFADATNLRTTILQQAREWAGAVVGDLTRSAQEMKDKLADLQAQAQSLWNYAAGTLAGPLADLQAAYNQARQHFFDSVNQSFVRVPEAVQQARDLKARIDDAVAALTVLGASAQQFADLSNATAGAVQDFVNDSLKETERLGHNPLASEREDIVQHFNELRTAFETIGASADQMARLEQARILALEDWWKRATEGIKSLVDDIRKQDPRVSSQQRFLDARQNFRDLVERARGGDLDALQQLQAAGQLYREQAQAFLGGGVGSQAALDEIVNSLQGLIDTGPNGSSTDNPVVSRLDDTNDILVQIRDGILGASAPPLAATTALAPETSIGGVMRRPKKGEEGDLRDTAASGTSPRPRRRPFDHGDGGPGSSPPILYIPEDGGDDAHSPEMVSLLRQIAEGEKKRSKKSEDAETRERGKIAADAQERAALTAAINNLALRFDALARVIEKGHPAGTS